jgi:hypothetical protein
MTNHSGLAMDYIYNSSGEAVGFVKGQYLFDMSGHAVGQIRDSHVHKITGEYVGELHGQMVVDRWKDADPDIPMKEAKAEYAKLQ